jgi:tetratricopeptide (TPR) repeat protein
VARRRAAWLLAAALMLGAGSLAAQRPVTPVEAQRYFERADKYFGDARYADAYKQYNDALRGGPGDLAIASLKGMIRSALRLSSFQTALRHAETLRAGADDEEAATLYADALWGAGLFDESDDAYAAARVRFPDSPRVQFGLARSAATHGQFEGALQQALIASSAAPRDPEILVLVAQLYEHLFRYDDAARVYEEYVRLLPKRIRNNSEAAALKIRLLKSFAGRKPVDLEGADVPVTVPFRTQDKKLIVAGALNGHAMEFVLDTGAEQTAVTRRAAEHADIGTVVETLITGVGTPALRKLSVGRADTIRIGGITIHDAPISIRRDNMPGSQPWQNETFSPAAFGLSVIVDYRRGEVTLARQLPVEAADVTLPLRVNRLPLIRGMVNQRFPAYFVIDTGGEMLSISQDTATLLAMRPSRHIGLHVWGINGLDKDAFVLPGVDLAFDEIEYRNFGVAVLNLRAPSVLLGFQLGGILGHNFLSGYRVAMDVARGELRLRKF